MIEVMMSKLGVALAFIIGLVILFSIVSYDPGTGEFGFSDKINSAKSTSGGIQQCMSTPLNCKQTSITIGGTKIGS